MAWSDYGSSEEKLGYFGKLIVDGRRRLQRSIKEGRNESGRNEHQERGSGTKCRNIQIWTAG